MHMKGWEKSYNNDDNITTNRNLPMLHRPDISPVQSSGERIDWTVPIRSESVVHVLRHVHYTAAFRFGNNHTGILVLAHDSTSLFLSFLTWLAFRWQQKHPEQSWHVRENSSICKIQD
jgi:hypothetical protein